MHIKLALENSFHEFISIDFKEYQIKTANASHREPFGCSTRTVIDNET